MTSRLAFVTLGWLAGWLLCWRVPRLPRAVDPGGTVPVASGGTPSADAASVTVVVPARDEVDSLPHLLDGLVAQGVAPLEIVIVDDGSTDDTGALARRFAAEHPEVRVLDGAPLPPGWTGKAWACAQGAAVANGELLVFLDADVRPGPEALASLLAAHREGLLSVQPFHRMERAYERLSAVFNLVSVMGVGLASPSWFARGPFGGRGAFGPCLVTTRAEYHRMGGHEAVRGEVVEDLALAEVYRANGRPVRSFGGGDLLEFRMYPGGPAQLAEGWTKNLATGAGTVAPARALLVALWVTGSLSALLALTDLLGSSAARLHPLVAAAAYLAYVGQYATQLRPLGNFGRWPVAAYPLVLAAFVALFARSLWSTFVRRRVIWRGRSISVSRRRRWAAAPAERGA